MHLDIEGIPVLFPFDYVYPEQLAYMRELKYSIENRGSFSESEAKLLEILKIRVKRSFIFFPTH